MRKILVIKHGSLGDIISATSVLKDIRDYYLEDELTVRSFVKSISKTSFFMNQIISRKDDVIVEAQIHLVFINKDGKPIKIPEEIYSKFKPDFCDTIKT